MKRGVWGIITSAQSICCWASCVCLPEGTALHVLKKLSISPEEVRWQTRRVLQESPVQPMQSSTGRLTAASHQGPLRVVMTGKDNVSLELTLGLIQLYEMIQQATISLNNDAVDPLYQLTIGDVTITITRGKTVDEGESPKPEA
jgi:hypothetical protein